MLHHDLADRLDEISASRAFELTHDGRDHGLDPAPVTGRLRQTDLQRAHQLVASNGTARPCA